MIHRINLWTRRQFLLKGIGGSALLLLSGKLSFSFIIFFAGTSAASTVLYGLFPEFVLNDVHGSMEAFFFFIRTRSVGE